MTEKKAEAPVQEPAPAPEAAGKIWKLQGKFPALADYLVFFGIFLLAQVVGAVTALLVGCKWPDQALLASADETVSTAEQVLVGHFNAVSYFVAMALTLVGFLFYRSRRRGPKIIAHFSSRGLNPVLLLWGVVFMLATSVVLEPLLRLMPELSLEVGRGFWTILSLVIFAPIFEELICRGVVLGSLRGKFGVTTAWLVSSLFFGVLHGQPVQVINATVIGLVLGYVYLATNSLWSVMILHALNNAVAYLALATGHGNALLIDLVGSRTLYVLIYIAALALSAVSGYMMLRALRRMKEAEKNPSAA